MKNFNFITIFSYINFVYSKQILTPSYLPSSTPSQVPSSSPSQVPSVEPCNKQVSTYVRYSLRGSNNDNKNDLVDFYIVSYDVIYKTVNENDTPCCLVCPPNKSMYYSIDTNKDMCGQTCIYDYMYYVYKIFEPGLTKTNNSLICPKKGYETFVETVTHGFLFIKDTLDLYKPFDYYEFRDLKY